ncbi:MAG: 2-oxoglutarate dehydrogenase complex dihydrolipoyllysine-residue succinyltransferase [Candidatus Competibacteraceae bacterium]|jgi:2-oxoglutarate dehydrogenase E2 component (dihydrolipoamide succinyltransferase)|nr:2-oxoglutarate dehydrogenase complex dihydrolipoyllysine-residue succinyltransferase [Candidatus Competibacteraceae bacterium]
MSVEVLVPTLPESVADATLVNWHKKPGDQVRRGENLVDLETDKVVLEMPAPADGVLLEILRNDGEVVTTGDLIANIDETATQGAAPTASPQAAASTAAPAATEEPAAAASVDEESLSPAVRRLVREHGLDVRKISSSGRGGRITKADVLAYMEEQKAAPPAPTPAPVAPATPAAPAAAPAKLERAEASSVPPDSLGRLEQRVPMTRLRARIAERLVEAQQTAALLTTFNEVNMQPIMDMRARYRDKFEKNHGTRLGFMSFFVKAVIEALKRFPAVNGSIDGSDMIYHGYYDIGIAVSSPRGLVVPILRDADQMSFADIEKVIADFGKRAQEGNLTMEELTGGTFSITNGGVFGSLMSTPILNPPQSAILGMHKTMERPMVENGQIVSRPMMYLALTYDHRIIDGREAVSSLVAIKEGLEDPARLLLQV